jgi:hypothetical protein
MLPFGQCKIMLCPQESVQIDYLSWRSVVQKP